MERLGECALREVYDGRNINHYEFRGATSEGQLRQHKSMSTEVRFGK